MQNNTKPNVVKDYAKLSALLKKQLFDAYPYGFDKHLISFFSPKAKKKLISVLPYETDEYKYMIRMTRKQAVKLFTEYRDEHRQIA